jgi:predicted flap endonuclease-1-like 5' DNA nuclease
MSIFDTIVSALRSLTGGGAEESTTASGSTEPEEGQVSVEHDPDATQPTPDASTEAAIKGGDTPTETTNGDTAAEESEDDAPTESTDGDTAAEESEDDAPTESTDDAAVAAGTDATASTGSLVDEEAGREPAETVGEAGGVDVDTTTAESDVGDGSVAGSDETGDDDATDGAGSDDPDGAGSDDPDGAESDDPDGTEAGSSDEVDDESEAADEVGEDDAESTADGSTESVETIKGIGPAYAGRLEEVGIETVGELAAADAAEVADGIDVSESRVSDWIGRAGDGS